MGNENQKNFTNKGDKYKIAVIGDTSAGKTMLLLGLIMTSKQTLTKRLTVVSGDHQDEITEMRKQLQKGNIPAGTTNLTIYNLDLQITRLLGRKASIYPLVFRDYKGGDIQNGISFFDKQFGDCDGALFLMNPGQPVLNLGKTEDADDATLSKLTNLINGISGGTGNRKCRAIALAAAVTAMDRIRKGGDLYAHRNKFYDAFNRYIVNPLKNNAKGIACKTDFKISVTGYVESQEKLKIIPHNNAADPFLWLIDRIERRKHPIRYWTRRLWPALFLVSLAAIGCLTWRCQYSDMDEIQGKGEYKFKRAQEEFGASATNIRYRKDYVECLSNLVIKLDRMLIFFPDVRMQREVAYTNLLSKYLQVEADAAFLDMKKCVSDKLAPEDVQAYALQISAPACEVSTPEVFNHYKALGYTQEVANATSRLAEHRKKKVPEVVSEYNETYFGARFDMLETNAAQVASQKYIQGLTNELAVWKQECSTIPTLSNNIEYVSRRIVTRCPAWRAAFASNIVQNVKSFEHKITERPEEIFQFEKRKLGRELRECLKEEEPAAREALYEAKKGLLYACRRRYFEQKKFGIDAGEYPSDAKLRDNLTCLLQDTTLTNCVPEWISDLHDIRRKWLHEEIGRVQDEVENAQDYSKFLIRLREGTGDKVHSLLENCTKWADEEADDNKKTTFDTDCIKVWKHFRARYFMEKKWTFDGIFNKYPRAEENLEDKIISFLGNTRITDVRGEIDKWLSKMREVQKKWLIDAMADCQQFPDGFDAFKEDGSGKDIKDVLVAAEAFIKESRGETEDVARVVTVKQERQKLVKAMRDKYFGDEKFAPAHEFSLRDNGSWSATYRSAETEISEGLQQIFGAETGYDISKVTNEWKCALWRHERDWLLKSKSMCSNEVGKFNGNASAIIDFVTNHSGNPFLWKYVQSIKTTTEDLYLNRFKDDLERYAGGDEIYLEERFRTLHKNAIDLSGGSSKNSGKYAGLYDIFALRHLCTNGAPIRATSTGTSMNGNMDWKKKLREGARRGLDVFSDESWLSSEYKINAIKLTLSHPAGVVEYTTKRRDIMDIFKMTMKEGKVGDLVFLKNPSDFSIGKNYKAPNEWNEWVTCAASLNLNLLAIMEFDGLYGEEYIRRWRDPKEIKDATWHVAIPVPHLKTAKGLPASSTFHYRSFANKGPKDDPQLAKLTVSVEGEVVGPSPYDRINACIKKAQEVESDNSNDWNKRCREAEDRIEELNRILSEGGELDAGGQPR